jgi:hypothetical protein
MTHALAHSSTTATLSFLHARAATVLTTGLNNSFNVLSDPSGGGFTPGRVRPRPAAPSGPRVPIDNEIPDSANVQANPGQGANEPKPVENHREGESRQQAQLNLGNG